MKINIKIPEKFEIKQEKVMKGRWYLLKKNDKLFVCNYQNNDILQNGQLLIFHTNCGDEYIESIDWSKNDSRKTLSDNGYVVIMDITDKIQIDMIIN